MKKVLESIEETYDWYIITRTDLSIESFPELNDLLSHKIYVSNVWANLQCLWQDNLYIVHSHHMHVFKTLYDNYDNLFNHRGELGKKLPSRLSVWQWHGEYIIPFQFVYHEILDEITRITELETTIIR